MMPVVKDLFISDVDCHVKRLAELPASGFGAGVRAVC